MNSVFKKMQWTVCALLLATFGVSAYSPMDALPQDTSVVTGTLANGLKYYIRRNTEPKDKAVLRLVVNAGSILEDEDQRGLAHFQEHLAFKGTTHFPGTSIINSMEAIGIKFGVDLNAYTSFDQTVYMLPVPSDKIDTGLQVLQDWAANVQNEVIAIDKERGVILEESRLGKSARMRAVEQLYPVLLYGSKYPQRLPIGKDSVIASFPYERLRQFYRDWYRPDLMAVIAVGDFDPQAVQQKVEQSFSALKNPPSPRQRVVYPVPEYEQTLVSIVTDKEIPYTSVEIYFKGKEGPQDKQGDYRRSIEENLAAMMLSTRLDELTQQADAPFLGAGAALTDVSRDSRAFIVAAQTSEGGASTALKAIAAEAERARRFGFTQSELDRIKAAYLNSMEQALKEKDKTPSNTYVEEYQRNFLSGEPFPGIAYEYGLVKKVLPLISVEDVNGRIRELVPQAGNTVVSITGTLKEGVAYPSQEEVLALLDALKKEELTAYDAGREVTSLMQKEPRAGKVKKTTYFEALGITQWTLSNGAKVVLKPTDFKNDQILFAAQSKGGRSLYGAADDMSVRFTVPVLIESGLAGIDKTSLERYLMGKNASVSPTIGSYTEGMNGSFSIQDAGDMFRMIYLYFTAPEFTSDAFERAIDRSKKLQANSMDDPQTYFSDQLTKVFTMDSPRAARVPSVQDMDKVDFERVKQIYGERFADAADFTFFFVGSFTPEQIKPLVEQYIASLPSSKARESYRDMGIGYLGGSLDTTFHKGMEQKAVVRALSVKEEPYDERAAYFAGGFNDILKMRLFETLRQNMSGVYGVSSALSFSRIPNEREDFGISFGTNVESYDTLYKAGMQVVRELLADGPTQDEVERLKEKMRVAYGESLRRNGFWLSELAGSYLYGDPLEGILKEKEYIESLNAKEIMESARRYIDSENVLRFVLLPDSGEQRATQNK